MSERAVLSLLTNLLSESAAFGSGHDDSFLGVKFPNEFDDINGSNPSTKLISQTEHTAQDDMGHRKASLSETTGLLSANAEGAQYALRKLQTGLNKYFVASEFGGKVAVGGSGVARSRAFGAFTTTTLPDVQSLKGGIPTLVNHNGGTFGAVSTGGIVKKPTTSTLPRPTTAAFPLHNPTWGHVGEGGDMKPPTTTTKPKAGRRPVGLRNGFVVLRSMSGRDWQIY